MKNILFVNESIGMGGKERQMSLLINNLYGRYSVTLVLRENKISFDLNSSNVKVFFPARRLSNFRMIFFLIKIIQITKPDIIHSWNGVLTFCCVIAKILSLSKARIIDGSVRYSKKQSPYTIAFWLIKVARFFSARVVANSKSGLISINKSENKKYKVIYNGFDGKRLEKLNNLNENNNNVFAITQLANFTPPKDYKTLVLSGLHITQKYPEVVFHFVGDGPERENIEKLIPNSSKRFFVFHGQLEHPEEILLKSDVGVLLNKKGHCEGMSNSIMEYMAFALPVICTNDGGSPELVSENETGFLLKHEDMTSLIASLEVLIKNPELRKKMGNAGKQKILTQFSTETMAANYYNLYDNL